MYRLNIGAFVSSSETASAIKEAMDDISLTRSHLSLYDGGLATACAHFSSTSEATPELLVVEDLSSEEEIRQRLEILSEYVSPGTKVVVIGKIDRIDFYRDLTDMGVGEYLLSPLTPSLFIRGVRTVHGDSAGGDRGRVISVIGAKGGVGSSTVAHNLAWSMGSIYEKPVSLVDMDLHFGTVTIDYNNEVRNGFRDAVTVASQGHIVDEVTLERLFTKVTKDVWLMASTPSMIDSTAIFTPESVVTVVDVVARMSTFVILDLPHMWSPSIAAAMEMSDEIIIVTDSSLAGLRNTQIFYESLAATKPHGTTLRYIVNGSGQSPAHEVSAKDFSETIGGNPLVTIPWNPAAFRSSAELGHMLAQDKKNLKLAGLFDQSARIVSGKKASTESQGKKSGKPGLLDSLFKSKKSEPK